MEVRELRWTDFDGWLDLYYSRYVEVDSNPELGVMTRDPRPSLGEEAELFGTVRRHVLEGDAVASVAEEGSRLVGLCTVWPAGRHVEDAHLGTLGMFVHADHRRHGVGSILLTHALAACRGRFEIVQLAVLDVNRSAIRLYERHGFREHGRLPRAFRRGERYHDEVLMWRPIEPAAPTSGGRADPA